MKLSLVGRLRELKPELIAAGVMIPLTAVVMGFYKDKTVLDGVLIPKDAGVLGEVKSRESNYALIAQNAQFYPYAHGEPNAATLVTQDATGTMKETIPNNTFQRDFIDGRIYLINFDSRFHERVAAVQNGKLIGLYDAKKENIKSELEMPRQLHN